jgi:hypothetical protein
MKNSDFVCALIVTTCFVSPVFAASGDHLKQAQVSKKGRVPNDGIKPQSGFIPNSTTAIEVAIAVLGPIYGADQINMQKPFTAVLRGDVWVVQGSMEHATGVAEVNLSKRTGTVLRVVHGK